MEKSKFKIGESAFIIVLDGQNINRDETTDSDINYDILKCEILGATYYPIIKKGKNNGLYKKPAAYTIKFDFIFLLLDPDELESMIMINLIGRKKEKNSIYECSLFSEYGNYMSNDISEESLYKTQEEAEEALEKYLNKNHPRE